MADAFMKEVDFALKVQQGRLWEASACRQHSDTGNGAAALVRRVCTTLGIAGGTQPLLSGAALPSLKCDCPIKAYQGFFQVATDPLFFVDTTLDYFWSPFLQLLLDK